MNSSNEVNRSQRRQQQVLARGARIVGRRARIVGRGAGVVDRGAGVVALRHRRPLSRAGYRAGRAQTHRRASYRAGCIAHLEQFISSLTAD